MSLQPPGDLGRRLLPTVVDKIAAIDPQRVVYSFMKTQDPADGFQDVSASTFAKAVDRCAWHIEKSLGRGTGFPTLLYMGPQDLVYAFIVLAGIKTGYKILLSSPRNTLEVQLSLLSKTDCNTFLMPPEFPLSIVTEILSAREIKVLKIPGSSHWMDDGRPVESYPYSKTWEEAALEPFVVLHTSGSTGTPKPVVISHKSMAGMDAFNAAPSLGYPGVYPNICKGTRLYFGMPYFHLSGVLLALTSPWFSEFTAVSGPFPPSVDMVNSIHVHGNVQHSVHAAVVWAGISENPEYLENLRKLDGAAYGGGPCPEAVGDAIAKRTQMWNCVGATETGVLPIQPLDNEDWKYISPSPLLGHEFRPVADNLYELFIVRDPELDVYQAVFGTFPELNEYSMKDLYSKHPTKPNTWLHKGRADNIVVFTSGEKFNALDMEGILLANPNINGAVVVGQGYKQASLIIEPQEPAITIEEKNTLLAELWPVIEAANNASPSQGRVDRNMVVFTSPDKPMPRAGKGTIQRKPTLDLYADEIKDLYSKIES